MMSITRRTMVAAAAAGLALACSFGAQAQSAQSYPERPVMLINPFPVGGGPDALSRVIADQLAQKWGKPVTVDNRPGGNGFIAINAWKRAPQDGTSLLILDNVHLAAYPSLFKQLPYDAEKDFDTLLPLFRNYFFVAVGKDSKYQSVGDIVADAKANPGKLNYGSWSVGNPVHLGSEMLEAASGTEMEHVMYKETAQLYAAVSTGEIDFALGSLASTLSLYQGGRLRYLAITAPERSVAFPDIPTIAEAGGPEGIVVTGWNAIAVPPGLPQDVKDKIRTDLQEVLASPMMAETYKNFGYEPFPVSGEEFKAFIAQESQRFGDAIRSANVSLD